MGTDDVPVFPQMHEAAAHVVRCDSWPRSARSTRDGPSMRSTCSGGCTTPCRTMPPASASTTTSTVGIRWLLDQGVQRVAYVDVDAHHGDGVETTFYDDPRVLTISLHENGRTLFPGSGWPGTSAGQAPSGLR